MLFCDRLHVPLFLDTIGTVALTFYAGLFPGLAVAVLFNIIRTLILATNPENTLYIWEMLYSLCGMAIVFCTWLFSRKKSNFHCSIAVTFFYLVLTAIVSALASSIIGGTVETVIRTIFNGMMYESFTGHFAMAFIGEHFCTFLSCILSRIPMTILDRLVCTFAGFILYRLFTFTPREDYDSISTE